MASRILRDRGDRCSLRLMFLLTFLSTYAALQGDRCSTLLMSLFPPRLLVLIDRSQVAPAAIAIVPAVPAIPAVTTVTVSTYLIKG